MKLKQYYRQIVKLKNSKQNKTSYKILKKEKID